MKNNYLKIASILISLVLYFFVYSQSNRTDLTLTLPIEFKNLPEDKMILLPTNRQAQVSIRGPSHQVSAAATSALAIKVTLPDKLSNKFDVALSSQNLDLPNSVEAVSITPQTFELVLDDIVTKKVRVETPTIGTVNKNYKLISLSAEPKEVEIQGPSVEISQIKNVATAPLDLRSLTESGDIDLKIQALNSYAKPLVESINISYDITSMAIEKKYQKVPVEVRSDGFGSYTINPKEVSIEISGPRSLMKELKKNSLTPYIKIDKNYSAETNLKIMINLPQDVSLISMEPDKIKVLPVK